MPFAARVVLMIAEYDRHWYVSVKHRLAYGGCHSLEFFGLLVAAVRAANIAEQHAEIGRIPVERGVHQLLHIPEFRAFGVIVILMQVAEEQYLEFAVFIKLQFHIKPQFVKVTIFYHNTWRFAMRNDDFY